MANKISVTILTKNSSKYIKECLASLVKFDEIIILDNGSIDDTMCIAKTFPNVSIHECEFIGFGPLKNLAVSKASNEWILSVDSDEIFSQALVDEILNLDLEEMKVYSILRDNYYHKKLIKCCGWDKDYVNRLFNKNRTSFNDKQVHESLILNDNMTLEKLKNSFKHYSFDEVAQLLKKMDKYSTLYAQEHKGIKKSSLIKAFFRSAFSFLKNYFFQRGFLYGYEGLLISVSNANGVFYKYIKLMEENKKMTVSLIITTYNWPEALELVIQSVLHQKVLPDEIIIADDGSTLETSELLQKIEKKSSIPIHHIWQEDKGFRAASARNGAIRQASGEYLILIDGDMILHPHFIEDHILSARRNVFVQGSRVLLQREKTKKVLTRKTYHFSFFEKGLKNRKNTIHSKLFSKVFSKNRNTIKGIRTSNFALYKEDAYKVNGFNEMFVGWGREDSEFAVRLINAGVKRKDVKFYAIAYHLYHTENTRESLPENDKRLQEAIALKKRWCEEGLI